MTAHWLIRIGDNASVLGELHFPGSKLAAVRCFNRVVRTEKSSRRVDWPVFVDLFQMDGGLPASKATKSEVVS